MDSPARSKRSSAEAADATSRSSATLDAADLDRTLDELALAGRHADAIAAATRALDDPGLDAPTRMALLDRRAESLLAQAEMDAFDADVAAMRALARAAGAEHPALQARADLRSANERLHRGDLAKSLRYARAAHRAALRAAAPKLEVEALCAIADAGVLQPARLKAAIAWAREAAARSRGDGDARREAKAEQVLSRGLLVAGDREAGLDAARRAVDLARRCGDRLTMGNALNLLMQGTNDVKRQEAITRESLMAFEAAGYVVRQANAWGNLGMIAFEYGLFRRARRSFVRSVDVWRRAGARRGVQHPLTGLARIAIETGRLDEARTAASEVEALSAATADPTHASISAGQLAWIASVEGRGDEAIAMAERGLRAAQPAGDGPVIRALSVLGGVLLAAGRVPQALDATRRATSIHAAHGLIDMNWIERDETWYRHARALEANGLVDEARSAMRRGYDLLVESLSQTTDPGLRRNYVGKIGWRRALIRARIAEAASADEALPHLAATADPGEQFERLVDIGVRLNAERDIDALHGFVIDEATELLGAERLLLALPGDGGWTIAGSLLPVGEEPGPLLAAVGPWLDEARTTRETSLRHGPDGTPPIAQRSCLVAPLVAQNAVLACLYADLDGAFGRFGETDRDLVGLLANQAAVALANARVNEGLEAKVEARTADARRAQAEAERRANELALINGIQESIGAELSFDGIVDLVGDKLRDIFDTGDLGIAWYDAQENLLHWPYVFEHGKRLPFADRFPPKSGGLFDRMLRERRPIVERDVAGILGTVVVAGADHARSLVQVPIIASDRVLGAIKIENHDREDAFSDADVGLLQTIASSMGAALENARLFDETQRLLKETEQRAAELAVITSIQQGLASKLELQSVIDLVGAKLLEVLAADVVAIMLVDTERGQLTYPFLFDHGERFHPAPSPLDEARGYATHAMSTGTVLTFGTLDELETFGAAHGIVVTNEGGDVRDESFFWAPLMIDGDAIGVVMIGKQPAHAFSTNDVKLITTIAASLSVALQNARNFEAERRRVAELAVISRIQHGMSAELDFRAIVDLVGDQLRDVFPSGDLAIHWWDGGDTCTMLYGYEHGKRLAERTTPLRPDGAPTRILRGREVLVGRRPSDFASLGFRVAPGTDQSQSILGVPIIGSDRVIGGIVVEDHTKEDAFDAAAVRLVTTVAGSMGVALENARLFDETQRLLKETEQRNAELAVINSIQQGISGSLDFQGIVDLVGDTLREVLRVRDIGILWFDEASDRLQFLYAYEHGERLVVEPRSLSQSFAPRIRETRQPELYRTAAEQIAAGIGAVPGTDQSLSNITVPIIGSDRVLGTLTLEDYQRESAYGDAELRLLQTVASSMGVALENARLFDETQRLLKETEQRNAELAVINSIQQGIAGSLDFTGIVDLVGDTLREVLHVRDIGIQWFDDASDRLQFLYTYEHGERLVLAPVPLDDSCATRIRATRQPELYRTAAEQIAAGVGAVPGTDQSLSNITVPIVGSDRVLGTLSLEDYERESAYGDAELRLLQTVASSVGVALENARLFDETQRLLKETEQRNAELAVINSIQQGLVAQLDLNAIIELVGDKLREVFASDDLAIVWVDDVSFDATPVYLYEHGQRRIDIAPFALMRTERNLAVVRERIAGRTNLSDLPNSWPIEGTENPLSDLRAPIVSAGRVIGFVNLDNFEREDAFTDDDVRLLTTICTSMGMALQSARLFDETQRLLKETEQRNAELAVIGSIQQGMAAELDFHAVIDLVGDKLRDVTGSSDITICWHDAEANLLQYLYVVEQGQRSPNNVIPPTPGGLFERMQVDRRSIVHDTFDDMIAGGAVPVPGTPTPKSSATVPIVGSDRVLGVISLDNYERTHAFGQSDLRLLQTVAASMGVALENARLFDQTQRLLKQTEQRNAELAVLNSIQQGMSGSLDFQAIIDLVGDKLREVLRTQSLVICWFEHERRERHFLYLVEHGERLHVPPKSFEQAAWDRLVARRITKVAHTAAEMAGQIVVEGTAPAHSRVNARIVGGSRVIGSITVENHEREHAFSDSDVRLIETVAASMGVALENARLFDETQRLLKQTEQRAAELHTVNTVSQRLSGKLDLDSLIELVGEQVRMVFRADMAYVALLDRASGMVDFPYRHGEENTSIVYGEGLTSKIIETGRALILNSDVDRRTREVGATVMGRQARSYLGVPIVVDGTSQGVISVQNAEREGAYDENDQRLLETIAANVGVALQNARLFDEAQASRAQAEARGCRPRRRTRRRARSSRR